MTTTTGRRPDPFTIKAWDEQPWAEVEEAPKLTHARVTTAYTGDLEGEGTYQLLMVYHGADASYTGYERVAGSLDGRSGNFVLRLDGGFEGGAARTTWTVVEGSSDLAGLRGEGGYVAGQGEPAVALGAALVGWARPRHSRGRDRAEFRRRRRPPVRRPRRLEPGQLLIASPSPREGRQSQALVPGHAWSIPTSEVSRCASTSSWACRAAARDPGQAAGRRPRPGAHQRRRHLRWTSSTTPSWAPRSDGSSPAASWSATIWSRRWFGDGSTSTTGTTASSSTASPATNPRPGSSWRTSTSTR